MTRTRASTSFGDLKISGSNLSIIESYVRQLHGPDHRLQVQAAQALGTLRLLLPAKGSDEALRAASELGAWDALLDALNSGLDVAELEDAAVVSLAHLLAPPPSQLASSSAAASMSPSAGTGTVIGKPHGPTTTTTTTTGRPTNSPLVRRLLSERVAGDAFTLGQLAAVLQSSSRGSRGEVRRSS